MALMQAYQADILKDLDKCPLDDIMELHKATDFYLCVTKETARAIGCSDNYGSHGETSVAYLIGDK